MQQLVYQRIVGVAQQYLGGVSVNPQVGECQHIRSPLRSKLSYALVSAQQSKSVTGRHEHDCDGKAHCQQLINNFVHKHVNGQVLPSLQKLAALIEQDPIGLAYAPKQIASCSHGYCERCGNCSGHGRVACPSCYDGKVRCHYCSGGKKPCYHCGSSGRVYEGNGYRQCYLCAGHGRTTCSICHGWGKVTCNTCGGSTKVDCKPCDATGYFTHYQYAQINTSGQQHFYWSQDITPWKGRYIDECLKGHWPQMHLNRITAWHEQRDYQFDQGLPLKVQLTGELVGLEAQVVLQQQSYCCRFFAADALYPYDMNYLFDKQISAHCDAARQDHQGLKQLLALPTCELAFDSLKESCQPPQILGKAKFLSHNAFDRVKHSILITAQGFHRQRSLIPWLSLCATTGLAALLLLLLTALAGAVGALGSNAAQLGLAYVPGSLLASARFVWQQSVAGEHSWLLLNLPLLLPLTLVLMWLFGSSTAFSAWRIVRWYALLVVLVVFSYQHLARYASEMGTLISSVEFIAILWQEYLLLVLLFGILLAKKWGYAQVRRQVQILGSVNYLRLLSYKE